MYSKEFILYFTRHSLQLLVKIQITAMNLNYNCSIQTSLLIHFCTWIEPILCYHDPVLLWFGFDNHGTDVLGCFLEVLVGVIEYPWLCEDMGQQPLFTEKSKAQNYSLHIVGRRRGGIRFIILPLKHESCYLYLISFLLCTFHNT